MSPPQAKNKTPVHIEVIRITFLNTGLFLGALNPLFVYELGAVMGKYGVKHLEALLIPCKAEHTIKFEAKKDDGEDGGDPSGALGP